MKRILALIISIFVLSACTVVDIKPITNLSDLKPNQVLLVGKIQLIPKMTKKEQDIPSNMITLGADTNNIYIAFDTKQKSINDYDGLGMGKYFASVGQDKLFMVAVNKNRPFIYNGGMLMYGRGQRYILPGGIKFDVRATDKVVYMGTIVYHRNDYDEIDKVKFINDYKQAEVAVAKKFGKGIKIRRLKYKLLGK